MKLLQRIRYYSRQTDNKLLLFLLLLLNVKLAVKAVALIFIYCVRPDFRFHSGGRKADTPPFYLYIMGISCIDLFLYKGFIHTHYLAVFAMATGFWAACILTAHQLKLAVQLNSSTVIHNTLLCFFTINAIISFAQIAYIMLDAGVINPYRYQGMFQKYFISTGDRIKGISFDTSTTNAVICAAGVIYGLFRHKAWLTLLCMTVVLLTCSNFTNLLLAAVLLYLFIAASDRTQKSLIVCCWMLLILFMARVTPQNDDYALKLLRRISGSSRTIPEPGMAEAAATTLPVLTEEQQKQAFAKHYLDSVSQLIAAEQQKKPAVPLVAVRPLIPEPSIHSQPFQRIRDTPAMQQQLLTYISRHTAENRLSYDSIQKLPGKLLSFQQTVQYLQQHPSRLLMGCGAGNFSSKLAFRATALNIAGGYPEQLAYSSPEFRSHHLAIHLNFFSKDAELHSVANTPNSVYNQLAGEYGIAGLLLFLGGYVWFWARHYRRLTFGIPLLLLLAGILLMDYWFEQLSVIAIIELLLFADIKEEVCTL